MKINPANTAPTLFKVSLPIDLTIAHLDQIKAPIVAKSVGSSALRQSC
jgi:hypothetical protein